MENQLTQHLSSENPRILVVDSSKVVRCLIERVLKAELPGVNVLACETGAQAKQQLDTGVVDFVSTALRLPDMDGLELARHVREHSPQAYIPIVAISGDVEERLIARTFSEDITDYFDKALGFHALAAFIRGYICPEEQGYGDVLYVEDSRVVALATRRMLEKHGFTVHHVTSAEDALVHLAALRANDSQRPGVDLVLSDVSLKGSLSGGDLLATIRRELNYSKGLLPVLIMTGDDNAKHQSDLLRAGANDLVRKPIEERLLMTKLKFQWRVSQHYRSRVVVSV